MFTSACQVDEVVVHIASSSALAPEKLHAKLTLSETQLALQKSKKQSPKSLSSTTETTSHYYVSHDGSPDGDGSIENPLDVLTVVSNPPPMNPGDKIWLQGGSYQQGVTLFAVAPLSASVTEWFASPDGSASGAGTFDDPWDIRTAFKSTDISPGDTLSLRGGVYTYGPAVLDCTLISTPDNPIIIRSFPGEWATIDVQWTTSNPGDAMRFRGQNIWYRDFEVMNSISSSDRSGNIQFNGNWDQRYINLIVHDMGRSNSFGKKREHMHGCIFYNNGAHGLGTANTLYIQNNDPENHIHLQENILFNNYSFALACWSGGVGGVRGMELTGNVFFQNAQDNLLVADQGVNDVEDIWLRENMGHRAHPQHRSVSLGWDYWVPGFNIDIHLFDNYLAGRTLFYVWDSIEASGNTFYSVAPENASMLDTHTGNIYLDQAPTKNVTFVRPNAYEEGRANIVIYNWEDLDFVDVDVSEILDHGDYYEIMDAQNYLSGPIMAGQHDGLPIALPMDLAPAPAAISGDAYPYTQAGRSFNVFVLRRTGVAPPPQEWYVATDGLPTNSGTIDSPWDLQTALNHPEEVSVGDTIWLRGGVYNKPPYYSYLMANSAEHESTTITVRAYPNERVTIDADPEKFGLMFFVYSMHCRYQDLEITDSIPDHNSQGFQLAGSHDYTANVGNIFINCVIHDVSNNSFYKGNGMYGCIFYHCGKEANYWGHSVYVQTTQSTIKHWLHENIFAYSYGYHYHGYGAKLQNVENIGNVFIQGWKSHSASTQAQGSINIHCAGNPTEVVVWDQNYGWVDTPSMQTNVSHGFASDGVAAQHSGYTVTNNIFKGITRFPAYDKENNYRDLVLEGNTFFPIWPASASIPQLFPNNTYHTQADPPTGQQVFVRPNAYEEGRAHIIIFNWDMTETAQADLSTVLNVGDHYKILNGQNFYADPFMTGTYDGSPITLPLDGHEPAQPQEGGEVSESEKTGREFNVFVVRKTDQAPPPPPPPALKEFYVAPNGLPTNDGSLESPWDLQTALNQPEGVTDHSKIWMRGGEYINGPYIARLRATSSDADETTITLRSYPGEWAILDGRDTEDGKFVFQISGVNCRYWGFEITNTNPNANHPGLHYAGKDDYSDLNGNVMINCIIHNVNGNLFYHGNGLYGCILSFCGIDGSNHDHSAYVQANQDTLKHWMHDNIWLFSYGYHLHGFAGGVVSIKNLEAIGNVFVNAGYAWSTPDPSNLQKTNVIVRVDWTGGVTDQIHFDSNYGWHEIEEPLGTHSMIYRFAEKQGPAQNTNYRVNNNVFRGWTDFESYRLNADWSELKECEGNTFFPVRQPFPTNDYPNNAYHTTASPPSGQQIFVRPNRYEQGRGHIVVFNWDELDTAQIDLSNVLSVGDLYEVLNGQNYFGDPVALGAYDGNPIALPMAGLEPAQPMNGVIDENEKTGKAFNIFVVRKIDELPPPPPPPPPAGAKLELFLPFDATQFEIDQTDGIKIGWKT